MIVKNPVLKGFHPDSSMIYVDGTYYIANSTFEYYPGVRIHKSTDLVRWQALISPLSSRRLLDMTGNPASTGVWAPCLSYCDGKFYLVYSNMRSWDVGPFKDGSNFLITATDLEGEWSDPVYLNSSGFDASLFHDDDGKKYLINMEWNHLERGKEQFSGILLQEYDEKQRKCVGKVSKIFLGTVEPGCVEGPHLYKKDGWYYIFCAEGGTSYNHAEVVARSRSIFGPYEMHPLTHLLTTSGKDRINQKAGHASMCEGKDGKWYIAYLTGRPLKDKRCVLGRETSVQEIVWRDGWPYLLNGTNTPSDTFETDAQPYEPPKSITYRFNDWKELGDFQTLRNPLCEDNFRIHDGVLTVVGKESIVSAFDQSVLCRRQQHFRFTAETLLEFNPESFQHMAGLIYRYNERNAYYLFMSVKPDTLEKELRVLYLDNGNYEYSEPVAYDSTRVWLRLNVDGEEAQFSYSRNGITFVNIGKCADATIMSDECAGPMGGFTGAFVGMACQDLRRHSKTADFHYFRYENGEE